MRNSKKHFLLLTIGIFLFLQQNATAKDGWAITFYVGKFNNDALLDIVSSEPVITHPNFEDSYITVLAVSKEFMNFGKYFALEAEGQTVKHYGMQDHFEFNALLVFRWLLFPWDKYLDTSFALGNGLSYATEVPAIETDFVHNKSAHLLNYLMGEFAFSLPKLPRWSLVTRIHHRSGVYGLLGTSEGSNFIGLGVRYSW